jgi:hypothetical protein
LNRKCVTNEALIERSGLLGFMGTAINGERIEIARDEQLTREYDKMTAGRIKPSTCNF